MRDILSDIFENKPLDPMVSARQGARASLRKRFYKDVQRGDDHQLMLDGKPVMTPSRRRLAAPSVALADMMVREWVAQETVIDPSRMPVTRLANVIIDGVATAPQPVADEIVKYLGSDLVCYRAEEPAALLAKQNELWNPLLDWARDELGARFVTVKGIVFADQPKEALAAARAALPEHPWRLGAMASITTITGSALIALALDADAFDAQSMWAAAHVDEDYQMAQWGRDEMAIERRTARFAEYEAAAAVLKHA